MYNLRERDLNLNLQAGAEAEEEESNLSISWLNSTSLRAQQALERRLVLIRRVALLFSFAAMVGGILYFIFGIIIDYSGLCIYAISVVAEALVCLAAFWLAHPKFKPSRPRADWCAELICWSLLILITASQPVLGAGDFTSATFLIIPVTAMVLGLERKAVILNTCLSALGLVSTYSLQFIFQLYQPGLQLQHYPWIILLLWLILLAVLALCLMVFVHRLSMAITTSEKQADLLAHLVGTLNQATQFGANLSRELASVTAELNATALQQASGSQQQVMAVTEVTSSLEELSETATQIASNASISAEAARQAVSNATQVKEASQVAQASVVEGEQAVEQTIVSMEQVRDHLELLGQRLLYLTEQNRRVGNIVELINEISEETHLLALNASIEAAGSAGEGEVADSYQGERFGVIALEVKNLADRTREAAQEVRSVISEMQGAVAAAVVVAEESKKNSTSALSRSHFSGNVIKRLSGIIEQSALMAGQILEVVEEVNQRNDEIKLVTSQQRSANQQILGTMHSLSDIARQNAGAVATIASTVERVNSQLNELQTVLIPSRLSRSA